MSGLDEKIDVVLEAEKTAALKKAKVEAQIATLIKGAYIERDRILENAETASAAEKEKLMSEKRTAAEDAVRKLIVDSEIAAKKQDLILEKKYQEIMSFLFKRLDTK